MTGEVVCESAEQKGEERGTAIAFERTQFEVWMRLRGEGEKQAEFEPGELSNSVSIVEEELGESETSREVGAKGVDGEGEEDGQESHDDACGPKVSGSRIRFCVGVEAVDRTYEIFTFMLFVRICKLPRTPPFSLNKFTQVASIHISKLYLIHSQRLVSFSARFQYVE